MNAPIADEIRAKVARCRDLADELADFPGDAEACELAVRLRTMADRLAALLPALESTR